MEKTKFLIPIVFILVISLSCIVFSQTVGQFTVGNEPPYVSDFAIQDGAASWDSNNPIDTHDVTPNFRWKVNDPNPDSLTTRICIGSSAGSCDIIDEQVSGGPFNSGDLIEYSYSGSGIVFEQASDCDATSCLKTYYVEISVGDGEYNEASSYQFDVLNSVPDVPFDLVVNSTTDPDIFGNLETHDQTPDLYWKATDADNGDVDHWPADGLVYHVQVGRDFGNTEYLADPSASLPSATVTNPIPWGISGVTQAINTVYTRIWSTDNLGIKSPNYDENFNLVDNLPELLNIYLADSPANLQSCIDFLPTQQCFINPLSGDYTSVNAKLSVNDIDGDCSGATHSAAVVLCLVAPGGICNSETNADYVYALTFEEKVNQNCNFSVSIPNGDSRGIEFFRAPENYSLYINASSQAGMSSTPWDSYQWKYTQLPSTYYASTVYLGDRIDDGGNGIQLGLWNPGLSEANMTNNGNLALNIEWEATDPSLDGSTCSGGSTNICWDLTADNNQFQVDDDNAYGESTETRLTPANIQETPARTIFQPAGGLNVCDSMTCNNLLLDETLSTNFHIMPPLGLSPGTYKTNITFTIGGI